MALDGKTIIKEEITDKDAYEATASATRRTKGERKTFFVHNFLLNLYNNEEELLKIIKTAFVVASNWEKPN